MKRIISILAVLALALALVVPAAVAEENDNWLRIFLTEDPETLDVQMTSDSYTIPLNCFDRLVETDTVDGKAQIIPGLADTWDISDDGLTYTFHLHEGVTFHNGDPLTADDVVFTVNRMMEPGRLAKNYDLFYGIVEGAAEYYDGENEDGVTGVTAIDDNTVQFKLVSPCASFLSRLATPGGSIFNRESTEGVEDFGVNPAVCFGTGPFQVTEWVLGSKVTVVANPDYFKGAPQIDGIAMYIVSDQDTQRLKFEKGEVDVFNFDYAESQLPWFLENGYEDNIVSGSRAGTYYFMFNTAIEPLDNANVRKALQMSVDRQLILDQMYNGEGRVLSTFIPEGVLSYNPDAEEIPYDPDQAKAILEEEGYGDGFDMEIAITSDSETAKKISYTLRSFFGKIGVRATVVEYDDATYKEIRHNGELPSYYGVWSADYNDPDNFLDTFFARRNTVGRSINYSNEEVLDMIDGAGLITDAEERLAVYQKVDEAVVHTDAVTLPLYQRNHLFCLNPRVHNFKVAWNGWSDMSFYSISLGD